MIRGKYLRQVKLSYSKQYFRLFQLIFKAFGNLDLYDRLMR